jgi:peptidoglycan-associated lipoprotein
MKIIFFLCHSLKDIMPFSISIKKQHMRIIGTCGLLLMLLLTLSTDVVMAQRNRTADADEAFQRANYAEAINLYKKAYAREKRQEDIASISFQIAESNRMMNNTKEAEDWYRKAVEANYTDPVARYYLGQMMKENGKYNEAITEFNAYRAAAPGDRRADLAIQSTETAQNWKDNPTRHRVTNVVDLNSRFMDFDPTFVMAEGNSIVFTSSREEATGNKYDGWTGQKRSDLFISNRDQMGKWSIPQPMPPPVNTDLNEGGAAFSSNGNVMYFTRCTFEKNVVNNCKIYMTTRQGEGWSEPVVLPFSSDEYTVGHPTLSADGNRMYFASDMSGGMGGKDIWMVSYDAGTNTWGTPVNLGAAINTEFDEMYPHIDTDGTLYFASAGHGGMGGLDNFRSTGSGTSWSAPENLRSPLNSPADDFGIYKTGANSGFFSSTREGGLGWDDIYSFDLIELIFSVSGRVYDADTKISLADAKVELFGSDGSYESTMTETDGMYKFPLKENTSYTVSATVLGYLNKKLQVSTVGLEQSRDFVGDFDFALHSIAKPINLPEIYYDLDKATLRPESKKALDGVIETLEQNPNITIKIVSHTDSRASDAYNLDLSKRRAKSVVDYLIANGVPADRLESEGRGESELKISDAEIEKLATREEKEAAHQQNRRTEMEVMSTDYVPKQN